MNGHRDRISRTPFRKTAATASKGRKKVAVCPFEWVIAHRRELTTDELNKLCLLLAANNYLVDSTDPFQLFPTMGVKFREKALRLEISFDLVAIYEPLSYLGGVRADADGDSGGGKAGEPEGELEAEFEAMAMRAHQELQAVGERVLDGFEHALVREAAGEARARAATAPSSAGAAAPLPSRSSLSRLLHYVGAASLEPAGREPEESNVTLSLLRYARKGADVATSASDSGEVNAGIQPQGTGIPCAPHTDASMLTLIVAPTQPGLEVFATSHPTAEASAAAAVAVYKRGRGEGGEGDATAAGAETAGAWVSGFEPHELTRLREGAQWAGAADIGETTS